MESCTLLLLHHPPVPRPLPHFNGFLIATLIEYANNSIFQEFPTEKEYFSNAEERINVDVRDCKSYTNELEKLRCDSGDLVLKINLKNFLVKKLRLRVWGYSQREYLGLLNNRGLMKHKTYT